MLAELRDAGAQVVALALALPYQTVHLLGDEVDHVGDRVGLVAAVAARQPDAEITRRQAHQRGHQVRLREGGVAQGMAPRAPFISSIQGSASASEGKICVGTGGRASPVNTAETARA